MNDCIDREYTQLHIELAAYGNSINLAEINLIFYRYLVPLGIIIIIDILLSWTLGICKRIQSMRIPLVRKTITVDLSTVKTVQENNKTQHQNYFQCTAAV